MFEMVNVIHRQHARPRAGEDFLQQMMHLGEFGLQLVEQRQIIPAQGGVAGECLRNIIQRAGHIKNHPLPPEFALGHGLPVAREPFVARPLRPDIFKPFRLGLIPEQFAFVVRVRKILNLQPLILVERSQQQAKLFLKVVQVGNRAVGEVGRFKDKALGHITAAPQMIKQDQIADKEAVGWTFKHKSKVLGFPAWPVRDDPLDPVQDGHQLSHRADDVALVDGDVGFTDMRPGPFQVGARDVVAGARAQAGAQSGFGGIELADQGRPLAFDLLEFVRIHGGDVGG